jgi:hypothetical protein
MKSKKLIKPVGDQLFMKVSKTSPWEPANLSNLKSSLELRENPYSNAEKLSLPQFAFGRVHGETGNQQLYPTRRIVFELDTPAPYKGLLTNTKEFTEWSEFFKSAYDKIINDEALPFWIVYLTSSMCGLRFCIKLRNIINDEIDYKNTVLAFLDKLKLYGIGIELEKTVKLTTSRRFKLTT